MTKPTRLHRAAVALGKRGGRAKTPAKAAAARANGRKGGRPRKRPPTPKVELAPGYSEAGP